MNYVVVTTTEPRLFLREDRTWSELKTDAALFEPNEAFRVVESFPKGSPVVPFPLETA